MDATKRMKRTYGGRRGTLGYRDVLQTMDNSSTVFEALSIKNLKQLKRDTTIASYATWSNQQYPRKNRKKKVKSLGQKKIQIEKVLKITDSEVPKETCLTPDKSIRLNRTPDPFDLLCRTPKHLHVRKDNDLFDQLLSSESPQKDDSVWAAQDAGKNHLQINKTSDESAYEVCTDESKENCNNGSKNKGKSHLSTNETINMNKYKLNVEPELKQVKRNWLSESFTNIVNNANFLRAFAKSDSWLDDQQRKKETSTPIRLQQHPKTVPELSTSTPLSKRLNYSFNISPIKYDKKSKLPSIVITRPFPVESLEYGDEELDEKLDKCDHSLPVVQTSKDDTQHGNIPKTSGCKDLFEEGYISEPFAGYSNETGNLNALKIIKNLLVATEDVASQFFDYENVFQMVGEQPNGNDNSTHIDTTVEDIHKNNNRECDPDRSRSCDSDNTYKSDSYTTCDSDKSDDGKNQNTFNIEPRVLVDKLSNSMFYKYYYGMKSSEEISQKSSDNSDDCNADEQFNSSRNKSIDPFGSNDSVITIDSQTSACKEEELRVSITLSSESSYTDIDTESQSSKSGSSSNTKYSDSALDRRKVIQRTSKERYFVTTRRRIEFNNDKCNDSVMILFDDSCHLTPEKEKTILTCVNTPETENTVVACDDISGTENTVLSCHTPECEQTAINLDVVADNNGITVKQEQGETGKTESKERIEMDSVKEFFGPLENEASTTETFSRPSIVLLPGKKWERSLSIYRRQTMLHNRSIDYRASFRESACTWNDEIRRVSVAVNDPTTGSSCSTLRNPRRSSIRFVKESRNPSERQSLLPVVEDEIGFLSEDCDETVCSLSRLSLEESTLNITVVENPIREASARDALLRRCNQADVLPFHECYPDTLLKNCHKIGEGVYGEVFLYRGRDGRVRVMKVVPVQGSQLVNGEHQKTYREVISEVVIAMELSALRTRIVGIENSCDAGRECEELDLLAIENATDVFNEVLAVRCVRGAYPARLLELWELYDEDRGSENDSPESLPTDQQFVVLELANAGSDLESYVFANAQQAHALFYQVAFGLAVGEEAYKFEHRDLHWGNILIQPTDQKYARFVLRGRLHSVPRCGVAATIIDYTLSRVTLPLPGGEQATLYNDLGGDDGLFQGEGDYQFDVYRRMRDRTGNDWKRFEPYTNVLWLHYVLDKMITALRYRRTNTKIHKHYIAKLKAVKDKILNCTSAADFVLACE